MSEVLEELAIVITTELAPFKEGMAEVRRVIEGIKPTVGALGLAITSLIATGFQNVAQSADALRDVNRVLQGLGYDVGDVGGRIQQMAESLSDSTRYDDADILKAFKTLLSVTQDVNQAMLLWGPALDLAAAQGVDVETAAQAIARYVKDGGGQLVRWYPWLKDASTEAERMKAVTGQLSQVIGGAASRSASLQNAWADLKKTVGDFTKNFVPEFLKDKGLIQFLNGLSDAIKELGQAINTHMTPIQKELFGLAGVVMTLIGGPVFAQGVANMLGLGSLAAHLGGLAPVLAAVAAAVGILGAAWITNFGGIREQTAAFWAQIQPILKELWANIQAYLNSLKEAFEQLKPFLEQVFASLLTVIFQFAEGILQFFSWLFAGASSLVKALAHGWQWLAGETTGIWSALKAAVADIWNSVKETAVVVFDQIRFAIVFIWNGIKAFWDEWGATITASFRVVWDTLKLTVTTAINAIKDVIGLVLAVIRGDWSEAWDRVKSLTQTAIDFIKGLFNELLEMAKTWGSRLLGNFVDGINAKIAALKAAVANAAQAVKDFFGFHSPAKEGPGAEADQWMPNLIGMWADQLRDGKAQIAEAMAQIAGSLNIAPQINALAAVGGAGGGLYLTLNITGNRFRDREDIDYLVEQVEDRINRRISRGVGNWRG